MRLTYNELLSLIDYDPRTGIITSRFESKGRYPIHWGDILGRVNKRGYVRVCLNGKMVYAQRVAFFYMKGYLPDQVDHKNGINSDNRWKNLREADSVRNGRNRKLDVRSTTGVTGVFQIKSNGKFEASIKLRKKRMKLGCYFTLEEARLVRLASEKEYFGEYRGTAR